MTRDRALGLGVAALALAWALPFVFCGRAFIDELILASHARRVLEGEAMYRDIFEFLVPLSSWLPALLFKLTGPSLAAMRVLAALAVAITAGCLYHLARRLGAGRGWAAAAGLAVAGAVYVLEPGYTHHWLAKPFVWGAMLAGACALPAEGAGAWLAAGGAAGLACLTIQSDGLAVVGALGLWSLLLGGGARVIGRRVGLLVAGFALPVGLAVAVLAWQGALGAMAYDTWTWTLQHYKTRGGINDVRYMTDLGPLLATTTAGFKLWRWYVQAFVLAVVFLLPPFVAAAAAALAAGRLATWRATDEDRRFALVLLLAGALAAALLRGRADEVHVALALPAPLLIGCVLASRARGLLPEPQHAALRALPLALLVAFVLAANALRLDAWRDDPLARPGAGPDAHLADDPVVRYLRAHGHAGDRLAVYTLGAQYYFYGLPPATRFTHMLDPKEGYYDAHDLATFWHEVEASRARFLVFAPADPAVVPVPPVAGYKLVEAIAIQYLGKPARAYVFER